MVAALAVNDLSKVPIKKEKWLIDGIFPIGKLTLLVGSGGVGKTSLMGYILSRLWHEHKILYWDFEENDEGLARKLYGQDIPEGKVFIGNFKDKDGVSFVPSVSEVKKAIKDNGYDMLIIDPVSSLNIDDSSNNQQVRKALQPFNQMAGELGISVVGLHHTKRNSQTGLDDSFLGANAFKDAVKHQVTMFADRDGTRYIKRGKTNTDAPPLAWRLESEYFMGIDDDGEEYWTYRTIGMTPKDPAAVDRIYDSLSDSKVKRKNFSDPRAKVRYLLNYFKDTGTFTTTEIKKLLGNGTVDFYNEIKSQPFWFTSESERQQQLIGRPPTRYTFTDEAYGWLDEQEYNN